MKPTLISALLVATLAGCAAAPDLPSNYLLKTSQPEGLAVISLTLSGMPLSQINSFEYRIRAVPPRGEQTLTTRPHYGSATQHARQVGKNDEGQPLARALVVKGLDSVEPLDILVAGKPNGRLATLPLPAGEYEVHAWKLKERTPYGELEYAPRQAFSYRFSVKPGTASYLGRLHLQLDGQKMQTLALEDRRDADLAAFRSKYPALGDGTVTANIGNILF